MNEMDAIIKEFVVESNENLDRLDCELIELEKNPSARETLASIFRTIHSIKGATGFLGFSKLGAVAHAGESLLSRLRDGVLIINPEITSGLLALVDCSRKILSNIDTTGDEGNADYSKLIENLTDLQAIGQPPDVARLSPSISLGSSNPPPLETNSLHEAVVAVTKAKREQTRQRSIDRTNESGRAVVSPDQSQSRDLGPEALAEQKETSHPAHSGGSIRVDVAHLDVLMNLVGELVLTRNEMLQFISGQQDSDLLSTSQRLNFLTKQLQEAIMKTRMQPIDNVWNKFPRVVRDLALHWGKQVSLQMEGKETELDKAVIEAIQDPLTHLVRNSIDHGLETPEKRVAARKPAQGHLWLRAYHEGGNVHIDVADDGAGIDPDVVRRKGVERGMITSEQARFMDDQEAVQLIFLPGFSTAEKVTSLSGRGVGMDVVKTNIEKIGGTVSIQNQPGLGTTVKIRIPLTLAIMPALIVAAAGERYAIPQVSVLELVRLEGDEVRDGIERIHAAAVYRLRGSLLPLVWLDAELAGETINPEKKPTETNESVTIAVLQADDCKFGLVVDDVNDTEEIVVKPLAKQLRGTSIFSGATILGDGRVVLILDVPGLAIHARAFSQLHGANPVSNELSKQEFSEERQALLLFAGPNDSRMAIPLPRVVRLETFRFSSLERIGGQDVVLHRGNILPLVKISNLLQERRGRSRGLQQDRRSDAAIQAIICSKDGRHVGLVVDDILDTIEQNPADLRPPSRMGVLANAVIGGRVTEILDLDVLCTGPAFAPISLQKPVEAKV
jgi:two-component system chemotaxis sensor kinase CheA